MSQTISVQDVQVAIQLPQNNQIIKVNDEIQVEVLEIQPILNVNDDPIAIQVEGGGLVPITNNLTFIAGQNLSALRAVTTNLAGEVVYADNTTLSNAQVVGLTYTSASVGSAVVVLTSGLVSDPSWNWTKGSVFLGINGYLTQTAPTGGAIVAYVGRAITATQLLIDIDSTIITI